MNAYIDPVRIQRLAGGHALDWRELKDDPEETFFDECSVCGEKAYSYPRCQNCGTMDLGYLHSLQGRSAKDRLLNPREQESFNG